jgi:hypothetical protein
MTLDTDVLKMKKSDMANKRAQGNQGQHGEIKRRYTKQERMHTNKSYSHACL